jgi:hypothetical protein
MSDIPHLQQHSSQLPQYTPQTIGKLEIQHPHQNSTVSMKSSKNEEETNKYDASAKPTPFLIAGFNPLEARGRLVSVDARKNNNKNIPTTPMDMNKDTNNQKDQTQIHIEKDEHERYEEPIAVTVMPTRLQSNQLSPINIMLQSRGYGSGAVTNDGAPLSAGDEIMKVNGRPRSRSSHNVASPRHATTTTTTTTTTNDLQVPMQVQPMTAPSPSSPQQQYKQQQPQPVPNRRATQPAPMQTPAALTVSIPPPGGINPALVQSSEALKSPNSGFEVDWNEAQNQIVMSPTPFDDSDDDDDQLAQNFTSSLNIPSSQPQNQQQPTVTTVDPSLLDFFTNIPAQKDTSSSSSRQQASERKTNDSSKTNAIDVHRVANAISEVNRKRNPTAAPAVTAPPSLNASRTNSPQITSRHIKEHFQPNEYPPQQHDTDEDENENQQPNINHDDHKSGAMGVGDTTITEWSKWAADPDFYFSVHHSDSQTSLGFHKHQVTWRFVLSGRVYELELFHSLFSGKRRIRLNTVEILSEKVPFDGGSSHDIRIGTHRIKVVIFVSGWTKSEFSYQLLIDRIPFERAKRSWVQNVHRAMEMQREQHRLDEEDHHHHHVKRSSRRSSLQNGK